MFMGLSQSEVGNRVGVSYQQIRKYEMGADRISASRLFELSQVLDVPAEYFFEEISSRRKSTKSKKGEPETSGFLYEFLRTQDALDLNRAFFEIKDPSVRKSVIGLVRSLGR